MNTLYSFFIWRCFAIAKEKDVLINEQIRAKEVLVIGPKGEQLGLKSREDALTLASVAGFDLVLMNANAEKPVCKLMDYNKYKYEKAKKMKEASKKQIAIMHHRLFKMVVTLALSQQIQAILSARCQLLWTVQM